MALLIDTGILYALADADDEWHARARKWAAHTREVRLVPVTVVPEAAYLIRARLGGDAELAFTRSLAAGELAVESATVVDLDRTAALMEQYRDIGFVDATVAAVAERLHIGTIATTDRRHFSTIRPRHVHAFTLVP
jgi:hypothetical protein